MQASQPETKDTTLKKLAEDYLMGHEFMALFNGRACPSCLTPQAVDCNCPIPQEWIDDLAADFSAALEDRAREWLVTKRVTWGEARLIQEAL